MTTKLVFATNNLHKLEEVRSLLSQKFTILSLNDIGCNDDIPETANTLEGNALLKAKFVFDKYGVNCFSDDTGLEIDVLNGEPGVYSARYAGEGNNAQNNMRKVLDLMKEKSNRKAQFRTSIALILNGETHFFEGIVKGLISTHPRGCAGFGYDPIFIPDGYIASFAQLSAEEKNRISHRGLAVAKLTNFLETK